VADLIVAAVLLAVLVKAPYGLMGVRELRLPRRRARAEAPVEARTEEPVGV
jgi:branched-chain amino acid transport system permease protein